MKLQELFNKNKIIDLSFFNFRNAGTGAYFANLEFRIQRVNNRCNWLKDHTTEVTSSAKARG